MATRARSSKNKGVDSKASTIQQLQAENARLRELLEEAANAGGGAATDTDEPPLVIVHKPSSATDSTSKPGSRSRSRGKSPNPTADGADASLAPSNPWSQPTTLVSRPKPKINYYGADIRPKTPQEAAEEKQMHAVREAQWQGRQDGGYKATALVEKPTLTIRNAYEEKAQAQAQAQKAAGAGADLQIDVSAPPHAHAQPKGDLDKSPKILSEKEVDKYRPSSGDQRERERERDSSSATKGKSKATLTDAHAQKSPWQGTSPSKDDLLHNTGSGSGTDTGIAVQPVAGVNVQIVDRKEIPQLEQLPTDYMIKGLEVDVSKLPLPLTATEVEVRTAMVTGIRPYLPGALALEENLREQRVDENLETPDGRSTRPVSKGDGRPRSRGPAVDYTQDMVEGMQNARERVGSRGGDSNVAFKQEIRGKITEEVGLTYPPEQMVSSSNARQGGFLPHIHGQPQPSQQQSSFGVVQSGPGDNWGGMGPPDTSTWGAYPTTTTTTDGGGMFATKDGMGAAKFNSNVQENVNTNPVHISGNAYATTMEVENAVDVNVPRNNKGVAMELIPIFSEFVTGIMNRKRPDDQAALHVRDAAPKVWVPPQHPLLVNLLASAKPLWKTASTQIYDPNLYLTLFPPPPDKIVVSVVDIVAMYSGIGVMHTGNNTINNAASTVVVNVREYTEFMYELINKYNDDYVPEGEASRQEKTQSVPSSSAESVGDGKDADTVASAASLHPGSVIPHVSRVFEPSSLEWWRKYIKYVLVVRSKPSGQMLVKISKKLVDRLVQTLLINNSIYNTNIDAPFDGVKGIGAGVNTYTHLGGEHQDHQSIRVHETLWIHSWDFSHVKPVDYAATIHQIGWTNVYGRQENATATATATAAVAAATATAAVETEPLLAPEPAPVPAPEPKAQSPATNSRTDFTEVGLSADNSYHVVAMPASSMPDSGVTFENSADELPLDESSITTSPGGTKKKKPKNKWSQKKKPPPPVNTIPDELLERNARFEINHMMVFNVVTAEDEKSVESHGGSLHSGQGSVASSTASLNSTAAKQQTSRRAKELLKNPGAAMSGPQVINSNAHLAGVPSHFQPEHINPHAHEHDTVPVGTPSMDKDHHGHAHKIHSFAGNHNDGSDGVTMIHAHHAEQTVAQRMNSPSAKYRVMPNRSSSPGFFGGSNQKGHEQEFVGGYWNDNTDVQYEGEKNLKSTSNHSNEYPKVEPRPELFLDEAKEKERKRRKKLKIEKEKEKRAEQGSPQPKGPRREYPTADEVARRTIVRAREIVSTKTKFRTRKLTEVEAGLFRSPFAVPLVTETMRNRAEALD